MNFAIRLWQFIYLILAFFAGFLGIGLCLFIQAGILAKLKSFGVSYLSPYLPVTNCVRSNSYSVKPLWRTEKRPDFLNTKRKYSEDTITMKWKNRNLE